jgi:hypothetical protein
LLFPGDRHGATYAAPSYRLSSSKRATLPHFD